MSENLQNPVVKLRQLAASSLNTITKQLTKYNKTKVATKIVSNLIALMLKEKDESILKQYFEIINDSMLNMIINKNYINFHGYGQQLLKYATDIYSSMPKKAELIYELFDKIFISTKDILAQDILVLEDEQRDSIFWFLNFFMLLRSNLPLRECLNALAGILVFKPVNRRTVQMHLLRS